MKLRQELLEHAEKGDKAAVQDMLTMIANEAINTSTKPRYIIYTYIVIIIHAFIHSLLHEVRIEKEYLKLIYFDTVCMM